jgi:hypothetical protein
MSKEQDIEDIVHQLQGLQIEQSRLLQRLQWLTESSNNSVPLNVTCVFAIGDKVRIKNPEPSQANKGKIVKIGITTNHIMVQVKNGTKIVRASHNLTFEEWSAKAMGDQDKKPLGDRLPKKKWHRKKHYGSKPAAPAVKFQGG